MSALPEHLREARPPFRRIVCATGLSAAGDEAVRQAALLSAAGGALEFVSVATERPLGAPHPQPRQIESLVRASVLIARMGVRADTHIVEAESAAQGLLDRCVGRDLLVAPPGDVTFDALAVAELPVLVARRPAEGATFPDSILVAVDGTPAAHDAARLGARLAHRHGALVALVAAPEHDARHQHALQADIAVLAAATGARPLVLDEQSPPAPAIIAAAASVGASLIVLGRRPGAPPDSVSAEVARCAGCSVLVLRPGQLLSPPGAP